MKISMNTSILPIVNVGMYQSTLAPDFVFSEWLCAPDLLEQLTDEEKDYCEEASCYHFDKDAYDRVVAKYAIELVAEFLGCIAPLIQVSLVNGATINSPSYYNYRTDRLDFDVSIDETELNKIISMVEKDHVFFSWLRNTYRSYPGYICLMPSTKEEFTKAISGKDIERAVAAYLMFLFDQSITNNFKESNPQYRLYERVSIDHGIDEFIDDEKFHAIMGKVDWGRTNREIAKNAGWEGIDLDKFLEELA